MNDFSTKDNILNNLSENGFHLGEVVRPDCHLHSEGLAHEVADGAQLVRVEVDGHQQEHLAE